MLALPVKLQIKTNKKAIKSFVISLETQKLVYFPRHILWFNKNHHTGLCLRLYTAPMTFHTEYFTVHVHPLCLKYCVKYTMVNTKSSTYE